MKEILQDQIVWSKTKKWKLKGLKWAKYLYTMIVYDRWSYRYVTFVCVNWLIIPIDQATKRPEALTCSVFCLRIRLLLRSDLKFLGSWRAFLFIVDDSASIERSKTCNLRGFRKSDLKSLRRACVRVSLEMNISTVILTVSCKRSDSNKQTSSFCTHRLQKCSDDLVSRNRSYYISRSVEEASVIVVRCVR